MSTWAIAFATAFIVLLIIESILYVFIFCRNTVLAKRIILFLAKLQDIYSTVRMSEIDKRFEKLVNEDGKNKI